MRSGHPVLVVEDDADLSALLAEELAEDGYAVTAVSDGEAGRQALAGQEYELVLCDLRLPGLDGMGLLAEVARFPDPPAFILITAFGTVPQAVEALKAGADDFLTKPLDLEHLRVRVARTLEHRAMRREVAWHRSHGQSEQAHFHGLVGQSEPMRRLYDQLRQVAGAGGPVLIEGESGTGKELAARAVHAESPRAGGPFVAVNCASVPSELMESELFGHHAGAFTGAGQGRRGLFAEADGGTLFLDEVGDMPLSLQATLLRVLQDGRVRPVGGEKEQQVDVRVVTATNRDLHQAMEAGEFRSDLYYRLETFALRLPPLRERGEDVDLLIGRFVAELARELGRGAVEVSEEALACLQGYAFPGNVRELRNTIERAVTFCREGVIRKADLPERIQSVAAPAVAQPSGGEGELLADGLVTLAELERRYVARVLESVDHNKRAAAEILGISRRSLYRYLERAEAGN